jgi:hypothetical protein
LTPSRSRSTPVPPQELFQAPGFQSGNVPRLRRVLPALHDHLSGLWARPINFHCHRPSRVLHTQVSILFSVNVKVLHFDNNPVGVQIVVQNFNQVQAINSVHALVYLKR